MQKLILTSLLLFILLCVSAQKRTLDITYPKEGQIIEETIPLDFINKNGEIYNNYIDKVLFGVLDSISMPNNNPDNLKTFVTWQSLDFSKDIVKYSPEYYAVYTTYATTKAMEYYNKLFNDKIDFNSQENCFDKNYKEIEIVYGDIPFLTDPKTYIFEDNLDGSPSIFFHEVGHRAFWYIQDETEGLGVKFKGLSYIHMGLLEYFTVSLNNSPLIGEGFLPSSSLRNASWIYSYPAHDSLKLETTFADLKISYAKQIDDTSSNISKFYNASMIFYKDYMNIFDNHRTGMILTSTLWRIRQQIGQNMTDNLVAQTVLSLNEQMDKRSDFYLFNEGEKLPEKIDWCDLYYGLIQKDKELNKGEGNEVIMSEFKRTGFPIEKIKL